MKLIFIATHGQSFTEQGFIINKLTSDVYMEEELLIAQIVIFNAMNSAYADAGSFPITKEIRQSCKKASQTQTLAQKSKKGDVQKSEKEEEED